MSTIETSRLTTSLRSLVLSFASASFVLTLPFCQRSSHTPTHRVGLILSRMKFTSVLLFLFRESPHAILVRASWTPSSQFAGSLRNFTRSFCSKLTERRPRWLHFFFPSIFFSSFVNYERVLDGRFHRRLNVVFLYFCVQRERERERNIHFRRTSELFKKKLRHSNICLLSKCAWENFIRAWLYMCMWLCISQARKCSNPAQWKPPWITSYNTETLYREFSLPRYSPPKKKVSDHLELTIDHKLKVSLELFFFSRGKLF